MSSQPSAPLSSPQQSLMSRLASGGSGLKEKLKQQ